jgi:hypothetical protein
MLDLRVFETRKAIIAEILGKNEVERRADMLKRHDIYRGKSKPYLEARIAAEFNPESVREMRIAPINALKKVVDAKSIIYKSAPIRRAVNEASNKSDQMLIDYYTKTLSLDDLMGKDRRWCL